MTEHDFTIVTPSYNYGHFIAECLKSVADQKGVTVEHIIIDACSTDNTPDVVKQYTHASFISEPDKGMSDGINKGFLRAKGKWVMWLNADDRLKPNALLTLKDYADKNEDADIIHGGWDFIDENGDFIRRMTAVKFDFRTLIQHGCYIGSTSCFFKKETTIDQGFILDTRFGLCMDGEYYARLYKAGKRFQLIPAQIAEFRLHNSSISQSNLNNKDLGTLLNLQRQAAEARALRRFYGYKPFRDENLSLMVDGLLYHIYRVKKLILRILSKNFY